MFRLVLIAILATTLAHCRKKEEVISVGSKAPHLLHVSNGSKIGYYRETGAYGFTTSARSIFVLDNGTSPQAAQNPITGQFYLGSSCDGCPNITFLDGITGGYAFSSLVDSQIVLAGTGKAEGVALNTTSSILYVSESVQKSVFFLNSITGAGNLSSTPQNSFVTFTSNSDVQSLKYLAVHENTNKVLFTDPTGGKIFYIDGKTGALDASLTTGLSLTSANCVTLSYPLIVTSKNRAYVLCNGGATSASLIMLDVSGTPAYAAANSLALSTFNLVSGSNSISTATDLIYLKDTDQIAVVGNSFIILLNGSSGAVEGVLNLASNCDASAVLSAIVKSTETGLLFVADSVNSKLYKINSDLTITGTCTAQTITLTDITAPTRLSFF